MSKKTQNWDKELWTQQEVADYFRVAPGTIKNWRARGLLSFWQGPGSTRVLYFSEEIKDFRNKHTNRKKGGDRHRDILSVKKGTPVVSAISDNDWRI